MNLLDASLIGTLIGTVISQVWNVVENRKKSRLDIFLAYTKKYNDIALKFADNDNTREFSSQYQKFAREFFTTGRRIFSTFS